MSVEGELVFDTPFGNGLLRSDFDGIAMPESALRSFYEALKRN